MRRKAGPTGYGWTNTRSWIITCPFGATTPKKSSKSYETRNSQQKQPPERDLSQKTVVFGKFWFAFFPRNHCKIEKNQKSASRKHAFSGTARNGRSRSTAFSDTFSRPLVFFALSCTRKRRTFSIFSLLQWFRRENGLRNHFFGDPAHVPKTPPWGGRVGICPRYIQRTPGVLSRVPREAPRKEERMEGREGRKQRRTMRQGDSQFYIYKLPIDRQRGCYVN